jgi:hypothetical protein
VPRDASTEAACRRARLAFNSAGLTGTRVRSGGDLGAGLCTSVWGCGDIYIYIYRPNHAVVSAVSKSGSLVSFGVDLLCGAVDGSGDRFPWSACVCLLVWFWTCFLQYSLSGIKCQSLSRESTETGFQIQ